MALGTEMHSHRSLPHLCQRSQHLLEEAHLDRVYFVWLEEVLAPLGGLHRALVSPNVPSVQMLAPHILIEVRMPEVSNENDTRSRALVDYLVLETVIKDDALAGLPLAPLGAYADTGPRLGHFQGKMDADPYICGTTMWPDDSSTCEARKNKRPPHLRSDLWTALANQVPSLGAARTIHRMLLPVLHKLEICPVALDHEGLVRDWRPKPPICVRPQGAELFQNSGIDCFEDSDCGYL